MRSNGIWGNRYEVCDGNFFGRKYNIKGIYDLIRTNSNVFVIPEDIGDDLRRYDEYRAGKKRKYMERQRQKLLKSGKGSKENGADKGESKDQDER
jgi:hypothetical protein